ncbi:MAG: hypothetical protein GY760_29350 [Deltaproteobacteria bacterium]|nr:hypothetical protein [Deltaproteobacteria bacterium]
MKQMVAVFITGLIILSLSGCDLSDYNKETGLDGHILKGKIRNLQYNFISGIALEDETGDNWNILLYPDDPADTINPFEKSSYSGCYPFVSFSINQNSSAQIYSVTTLGSSGQNSNSIQITGWSSGFEGVWFDDGELEITGLDLVDNIITGRIHAISNEGTSCLDGSFTAQIEH